MHLFDLLNPDWKNLIVKQFTKNSFDQLSQNVLREYGQGTIYPNLDCVFAAFNSCFPEDVKVVIIGQDPYHGPMQANGFAFSVNKNVPIPPSLKNIFKELQDDIKCSMPSSGDLKNWANQGVLLLNTTLTVRANEANSHAHVGWNLFTDAIINSLSKQSNHLVFILWGSFAQSKSKLIGPNHSVIKSAHPSPLSVYRGFWGSKPFSKANEALVSHGQEPIKWELD